MDSVLNPEAPEFHPMLSKLKDEAIAVAKEAVEGARRFPSSKTSLYHTIPEFIVIQSKFRKFVITKANEIMYRENPTVLLKWDGNHDINTDKVMNVTDNFLDRININIDSMEGVNASSMAFARSVQIASCSNTPVTATIKVKGETATLIGAKNIPRPQLMFKYPVDNSSRLFVPRISDKPNSMKALALNILYDDEGQPIGYEHPYKTELEAWLLPEDLQEPGNEPMMPPPVEQTRLTLVDTEPRFDQLLRVLQRTREFAVDVEHHSYRTYQGITCLIQISTDVEGDYIIDALALREELHKLNLTFTDPNKLKVFHGAENDVLWLQRDFGVYVVGMFDTHQAARQLRLPRLSLQFLLQHYCNTDTDKQYQMADWRMRPLPAELLRYARTDTHYLLYIWRCMRRELLAVDPCSPQLLHAAIDNSRRICALTYKKEVLREDSHIPLYLRSRKTFTTGQLAALRLLYRWRDSHAREEDESPLYLLPNQMLLALAEALPRELQGIGMLCTPMPPFLRQHAETVHRIILSCRQIPDEPRIFSMPASVMGMLVPPSRLDHYTVHDFAHFPDPSTEPINLDAAIGILAAQPDRCVRADLSLFDPDAPEAPAPRVAPELAYIVNKGRKPPVTAEAQRFLSPFERYKMYRILRQKEEVKALREKEAKVAAIGKGNELIWEEVVIKLGNARAERAQEGDDARPGPSTLAVDSDVKPAVPVDSDVKPAVPVDSDVKPAVPVDSDVKPAVPVDSDVKPAVPVHPDTKPAVPVVEEMNSSQRKRKMTDKSEQKDAAGRTVDTKKYPMNVSYKGHSSFKSFNYKNVDYKRFYNENNKGHKQPKMKFKKS